MLSAACTFCENELPEHLHFESFEEKLADVCLRLKTLAHVVSIAEEEKAGQLESRTVQTDGPAPSNHSEASSQAQVHFNQAKDD